MRSGFKRTKSVRTSAGCILCPFFLSFIHIYTYVLYTKETLTIYSPNNHILNKCLKENSPKWNLKCSGGHGLDFCRELRYFSLSYAR